MTITSLIYGAAIAFLMLVVLFASAIDAAALFAIRGRVRVLAMFTPC